MTQAPSESVSPGSDRLSRLQAVYEQIRHLIEADRANFGKHIALRMSEGGNLEQVATADSAAELERMQFVRGVDDSIMLTEVPDPEGELTEPPPSKTKTVIGAGEVRLIVSATPQALADVGIHGASEPTLFTDGDRTITANATGGRQQRRGEEEPDRSVEDLGDGRVLDKFDNQQCPAADEWDGRDL